MFQAGVKGMSERSELIPCNELMILVVYLRLIPIEGAITTKLMPSGGDVANRATPS